MPRWPNNLEQNCKEVMDNAIKEAIPDIEYGIEEAVIHLDKKNNIS